jgi:hypothetical protein
MVRKTSHAEELNVIRPAVGRGGNDRGARDMCQQIILGSHEMHRGFVLDSELESQLHVYCITLDKPLVSLSISFLIYTTGKMQVE